MSDQRQSTPREWQGSTNDFNLRRTLDGHRVPREGEYVEQSCCEDCDEMGLSSLHAGSDNDVV